MKRKANMAEKRHMGLVTDMGCVVCSACLWHHGTPAEAHHVRLAHGWGRTSHFATIPLCYEHHRGNAGVHAMGRDEFTAMYGKSEIDLLGIVNEMLGVAA
jgi:hypothetical protein